MLLHRRSSLLHSRNTGRGGRRDSRITRGHLGPVIVWLGVAPRSTSSDLTHEISQKILTLLADCEVKDVVVEWRESVLQRLGGSPPLLGYVGSTNPTHHLRRFLTALLGVPLATQGVEKEGTLTLWFHETRDKNGNVSNNVYGVSNCHVLCKNTTVDYELKARVLSDYVRVCGVRRFQRALDEISSISVTTSFAPAFILKRLMGWKRRIRRRLRTRSPRTEPSWTSRTRLSANLKP